MLNCNKRCCSSSLISLIPLQRTHLLPTTLSLTFSL